MSAMVSVGEAEAQPMGTEYTPCRFDSDLTANHNL